MKGTTPMRSAIALVAVALLVAGCATQPAPAVTDDPPGFLLGLLHGVVAPFSLVYHLFAPEVRVYAFPNSGAWYDFGFLLGIGGLGSSVSVSVTR